MCNKDIVIPASYVIYVDDDGDICARDSNGNIKFKSINADAATVVQNAINNLTVDRTWKEKVVLKGNFTISTKVTLASNLILDLRQSKFILANNVNDNMFDTVATKNNIDIFGGVLDGNKTNQASGNILRVQGTTSDNIKIIGTIFQNAKTWSIHMSDVANTIISQCIFNTCGDRNIVIDRSNNIRIVENLLTANGANASILVNAAGADISKIEIENNIIKNAFLYGILFDGTFSMYDCKISGNLIDTTGQSGICINSGNLKGGKTINRFDISRNILLNTALSSRGISLDGILIGTSADMNVCNNNIYQPSADGISTLSTIRSVFNSNNITSAGFESGAGQGILIRLGISNIINGNSISLSKQDGIRLSGTSYSIVEGNVIKDSSQITNNTWNGISIVIDGSTNSFSNTINNNNILETARNKSKYGISEGDASQNYNEIIGNIITGVVTNTISVRGPNTIVKFNPGFKTEADVLSGTFAVNSIGIKTVTIAHGLQITPAVQDCCLTVVQDTVVDDWTYNLLMVTTTDATNVIAKIKVSAASTTVGATAKLALRVSDP